jgi:adhesin HecA-like repeat protein
MFFLRRRALLITSAALVSAGYAHHALATTFEATWVGAATGNYGTGSNWSGFFAPNQNNPTVGANWNVTINRVGGASVTGNTTATILNLTIGSGNALTLDDGRTLTLMGSQTNGPAIINTDGTLGFSAGSFNIASLALAGSTTSINGTGTVHLQGPGVITSDGTITNNISIIGQGTIGSGSTPLVNHGLIRSDGGRLTLSLTSALTNTGTIHAGSGPMTIDNSGDLDNTGGTFIATSDLTLKAVALSSGQVIGAGGNVIAADGCHFSVVDFSVDSPGALIVASSGTPNECSFTAIHNSGRISIGANAKAVFTGNIDNTNGDILLGSAANSAILEVPTNATFTAGQLILGTSGGLPSVVQGFGTARFNGTEIFGTGVLGNGSLVMRSSGTITALSGTLTIQPASLSNAFISTGTLQASSGGTLRFQGNGSATFDCTAARINIPTGSDLSFLFNPIVSAATLTLNGGFTHTGQATFGRIDGSGTILQLGSGSLGASRIRISALTVGNGGTVTILANGSADNVSRLGSLQMGNPSSRLDLTDNDLILDYSAISPINAIASAIGLAFHNGAWDQPGITSSRAATSPNAGESGKTALGFGEAQALNLTVFDGQTVDATSLLIKYTYFGDSDLDGDVDIADLGRLATHWQSAGSWIDGDFDYSGSVNVNDLGLLATNWQAGVGNPLGPSLAEALTSLGLSNVSVPEPTTLGLVVALTLPCYRRRRRVTL